MVAKIISIFLLTGTAVWAHTGVGSVSGLGAGFAHPIGGADHILAMVAVGLWATQIGGRALWAVPLSFVGMMIIGAFVGLQGVALPFIEEGILVSVVVLGALIGMRVTLPVVASSFIVGLFAIFHGYAHGAEMPLDVGGMEYATGFVLATAVLHVIGIVASMAMHKFSNAKLSSVTGGAIAVGGVVLALS
jgi:urease accessory protein